MTQPRMFTAQSTPDGVAIKDMSMTWRQFMGIPEGDTYDYTTLADVGKAPEDEPWAFASLHRIFIAAKTVPWFVYEKRGKDKVDVRDSGNKAGMALYNLLEFVNPYSMNGSDLKGYTLLGLKAYGASYWKLVGGTRGGPPQEIYWLPAADMKAVKDPSTFGKLLRYEYTPGGSGQPQQFAPEQVVPFRGFNLRDPLKPISPLLPARQALSVNRQAAQQTAATLRNNSVPTGYWTAPPDVELSPREEGIFRRAVRALRGPKNAGKVPLVPSGVEFKSIALTEKDAEWLAARKLARVEIGAVTAVPQLVAGDDENPGPYAYAQAILRHWWLDSLIPELDGIADTITGWIAPLFDPTRKIGVAFDYSNVESIKEPFDKQVAAWHNFLIDATATPNEARRKFNIGDKVDWGDVPILSTREQVYPGMGPANQVSPDGTPLPGGRPGEPPAGPQSPRTPTGGGQPDPTVPDVNAGGSGDLAVNMLHLGHLYALPAVQAYQRDPTKDLDIAALLGRDVPETARKMVELGIRRRYSAEQIALGVPAEKYPGLRALFHQP